MAPHDMEPEQLVGGVLDGLSAAAVTAAALDDSGMAAASRPEPVANGRRATSVQFLQGHSIKLKCRHFAVRKSNLGHLPSPLTIPDLFKPHGSYLPNELIARGFYLTKYIEHMGTGTEDMIERCIRSGLKPQQFEQRDCFTITIFRNPDAAFSLTLLSSKLSLL